VKIESVLSAFLALNLMVATAGPPVIGTVVAKGSFRVDDASVTGNATLFEGATVETRLAVSTLDLASGTHIALWPESKGRVFGDHLVLEKGAGEMGRTAGFHMEARSLRIQPETGQASARVTLAGTAHVQVAAIAGSLRVLNSRGLLIAALAPGTALDFEPPATPQAGGEPWKITGCLRVATGHFLLTDDTTNVTVELVGDQLASESGNRVEITGAMDPTGTPASEANQVLRVSQVKRLAKGCSANKRAPAAAGAATSAPATTGGSGAGGISITTIAIIGGVAVAAAVGGLAATGSLSGQASSPVSR
jgi:hypothetical protein